MKQRVITAICILVVAIPCIVLGGALLDCLVVFCALAGTYEYLHACMPERNTLFNTLLALLAVPAVINIFLPAGYTLILATIVLVVLYFFNIFNEKLDIEKISYLFQMFMLVTLGVRAFKDIRALGFNAVIYILLLTYVNDSMAMIGGKYLGKHKLIPRISP